MEDMWKDNANRHRLKYCNGFLFSMYSSALMNMSMAMEFLMRLVFMMYPPKQRYRIMPNGRLSMRLLKNRNKRNVFITVHTKEKNWKSSTIDLHRHIRMVKPGSNAHFMLYSNGLKFIYSGEHFWNAG